MRTTALLIALCGLGCGSTGDGAPDGAVDAPTIDGPPPGTALADRLTVSTIATPAGVLPGRATWRVWGRGDLVVSPVFTVPYADCGTLVGYTTGTSAPTARVARLDAADGLVTTFDLGRYELRGLAAEPGGGFATLLWDAGQSPALLRVTRFTVAGDVRGTTDLVDALAAPTDFSIGESRFEYGDGKYGAYFHVHGISGFANGHEGDAETWVDAASGAMTNGWSWGCSHSMSEVLRFDPPSARFLAACVTDCYPGTTGDFTTESVGGVYLDHARRVVDVDGACNGSVAGELGSAAPSGNGWKLVWTSHQAAATHGQGSYTAAMDQDVGFATIGRDLTPGPVVWLTTTPAIDEANSSVALWRPAGDDAEQYVVGWVEPGGNRSYRLARVGASGQILEGPIALAGARWGERDDPFRSHGNGDVVWAWFDGAGATSFHLARLRSGRTATCAAF